MLYLLDKDVRTVKWNGIPLHEASSAIVKEETNGDFTLTIRYPITDSSIYQLIKEDMLIKAPVPVLGAQLFRIKKPIENDDSLDITAYHITDDIMQRSINPMSVVRQGCFTALSQMVQNAKTDLGIFSFTSDITDNHTFTTDKAETLYTVLMDGKHSVVGTWEGELVRDNFALSVKQNRGADRGVVITTHKNLKSYQRTKNSQSVVTRIHARSTFRAEGAEEETTISVTVNSPLIDNYPYINEKEYQNNDIHSVEELRKWAERKFKYENIDKPTDELKIEAYELDGQVIHLGDTVNIKSRKHDVDIYKKAIAYEYNALTEEYISITFDDKPGVGGTGVSSGVSNAADVILNANRNAQEVAVERAIRNANQAFYAEFDKRIESINDGLEQSKAEAEAYADNIKQQIDGQLAESDRQYQLAQQNQDRQIAESLRIAGTSTNLANAARALAEQANNDLVQVKASAESQARLILEQAQRQSELINRVTTVENVVDGTKVTVTELSKTLNKATGDIDSVTNRTKSVEDNLSQTRAQYEHLTQTVNAQTGQIDSINRKTVDLQSGIDGVTQRFENLQIGGNNLLKNTKDFSGEWDYNGQRRKIVPWKYNGLSAIEADYPWEGLTQLIQVRAGEVYTFSVYVASSLASDSAEIY
ncbi:TPA: phage tail protein, partial [Streptococcus suis]|nr:phage tail protein [Streptococcus suis]HEM5298745.1 phage tail protein [Streptococcus suis]